MVQRVLSEGKRDCIPGFACVLANSSSLGEPARRYEAER